MRFLTLTLLIASFAGMAAAEVANMSGSWWLDVKRSRWDDKMRPPNSVALEIQHNEPALKYSGIANAAGEDTPTKFEFEGAIDGKPHTLIEDGKQRQIAFKRKSDRSIESVSHPSGSISVEESTFTLSRDGNTLEHKMKVRGADGIEREWVEVYEKRR
jgi:hypothetical protein